ncbi:MAG: hypothetical protein HOA84_05205, partial [Candidatus Jacksonbacteria bacterium]|nr:hypothetical protein [Candidatus Jacksonbacteria bacterium]
MARRGENRSGNGGESREYKVPPEYEGVVNAAKNIFGSREKSEDVIFSFDDDISELVGIIKIIYSENSGRRARNREVGAVKKVFEEAFDAKYSATSYKEKKERYLYDLFVAAAAEAGRGEVPAAEREKLGRVESAWQELKATFSASRDIPLGNRELSDPDVIKLIAVIEDIYNAHPKDNRRDRNARRNEVEAVRENYKQRLDANFSEEGNTQAKAKYLAEVFLVAESEVMARGTAEEEDETSEAVRELEESEEYKRDMATAESALYDAWKNEGESYVSAAVDAVRNVVRTIRANARKKDQDKVIEVAKERLTTAIVEKYASLDDEPEAIAEVIGRIFAVVEGEKKERKPKAQKESGPDYLKAIVDPIQQLSYEGFKSFSSNGSYQGTGEDIEAVREIFNALANEGKKTPKEIERAKRMLVDPLELLESQIEGDGSPKDYIDFLFLVAQEGEWSPRVQAQYETDKLRERVLRLQIEQANTASTRSREVAELSSILESLEEEDGDKVLDKIIVGLAEALEKKQNIREEDFDKLAAAITPFLKDAGFRRPKETSGEPEFECTIDARQLVVNAAQTLQYQKEQRYAEQVKDKKRAMLAKMGISSVAMATSFAFPPIGIGIGLALAGYNMGERGVQLRKRTKNEAQESRNLQLAAKMKHGNIYEDSREAVASLIAGEARRRLDVEIFRDEDVEINEEALTVLGKVMEGKTLDKNEQSLHTKIQTMVINKAEGDEKRVDEDGQLVDKTEAEKALDVRFLMNDLYLAGVEQSRSQQALKKFKHFETATEKARKEFMRSGLLIAASQGLRAAVPVIGLMAGGLATATSLGLGGASAALGGAGGWKLGGAAA